jgi:biopolymer transport protein TolR
VDNPLARKGSKYRPINDINVTPFVDVMLVLLIVFMITAPLLTTGVPVDLPKTQAHAIKGESEPLVITVDNSGRVFLQDAEIKTGQLLSRLAGLAQEDDKRRVYVRGDRTVSYGKMMGIMGAINAAGFVHVALVTEPLDK